MAKKVACVCVECSQFEYKDEHGVSKSGRIIEARYARQHMEEARHRQDRERMGQKAIQGTILLRTAGMVLSFEAPELPCTEIVTNDRL